MAKNTANDTVNPATDYEVTETAVLRYFISHEELELFRTREGYKVSAEDYVRMNKTARDADSVEGDGIYTTHTTVRVTRRKVCLEMTPEIPSV